MHYIVHIRFILFNTLPFTVCLFFKLFDKPLICFLRALFKVRTANLGRIADNLSAYFRGTMIKYNKYPPKNKTLKLSTSMHSLCIQ